MSRRRNNYSTIQKRIVTEAVKTTPVLFTAKELCDAELVSLIENTDGRPMLQATLHVKAGCPLRGACGAARTQRACEAPSAPASYGKP